ncbi:WecB/TagA/CpsF family glycosyltransferase [Sporolactobacillus sp. Y61]|uniref:WecB/TagA/CpsF family glycosyltransferase n=1 Tax=Sporolactobacillus sp. Y61 TaxID=3160863 RepID=A0AAU8II46_9BACL
MTNDLLIEDFLGLQVSCSTLEEISEYILINTKLNRRNKYFAINPDCILKYFNDPDYRRILKRNDNIIYIDGMGIIYAQMYLKLPVAKERVATTDLFPSLLKSIDNTNSNSLKIYLLGGKDDTAQRVINNLSKKYPNS